MMSGVCGAVPKIVQPAIKMITSVHFEHIENGEVDRLPTPFLPFMTSEGNIMLVGSGTRGSYPCTRSNIKYWTQTKPNTTKHETREKYVSDALWLMTTTRHASTQYCYLLSEMSFFFSFLQVVKNGMTKNEDLWPFSIAVWQYDAHGYGIWYIWDGWWMIDDWCYIDDWWQLNDNYAVISGRQ